MMDDLWYSTNLVTNEPLHNFTDIVNSQVWHYLNWGGRSITHTILQAVLMTGELGADIINLCMTLLLSFVMTLFLNKKNRIFYFLASFCFMLSFNANIQYSMFWQAGCVNYVYSTIWILTFLLLYYKKVSDPDKKDLPGIIYWIIPLAVITGWSNENMGPSAFCFSVMAILTMKQKFKKSAPVWMYLGSLFSLLGSAACILAPGNFVRSEFTKEATLLEMIKSRFFSMLEGGALFLLPSFLFVIFCFVLAKKVDSQKLRTEELLLLITAALSYLAMMLSPHFPDRASFGTMILCIILSLGFLDKIISPFPKYERFMRMGVYVSFAYDAFMLLTRSL